MAFIPDSVTCHTLEAKGYSSSEAAKKARRQVQYLRNKIERAADGMPVTILGCEELGQGECYSRRHAELQRLFDVNADFHRACLDTTRWVLASSPRDIVSLPAALLGVRYLLAELPLFLHAPEIMGRREVAFVYHQCPRLVREIYDGRYGPLVSAGQAFVEVRE